MADWARGHKKKVKKAIKRAILKLIIVGLLIKQKIKMLLMAAQTFLQFKFLLVAIVYVVSNIVKIWLEIKSKHHPQKVIYYENAHHQHHYEPGHSLTTRCTASNLWSNGLGKFKQFKWGTSRESLVAQQDNLDNVRSSRPRATCAAKVDPNSRHGRKRSGGGVTIRSLQAWPTLETPRMPNNRTLRVANSRLLGVDNTRDFKFGNYGDSRHL
ncbi:hypothetical protein J6590_009259 [Homalodisca vitripennis]|nr:hypothetical protein J6590_009259 [Homalodisca vitripennis]